VDEVAAREAYRHRLDVFLASRDVGEKLTLDALRRGITLEAVIASATDVATYADEAVAIVHEEYRPRLACCAGCSYCCRKPGVLATVPEFLRIIDRVRSTFGEPGLHDLTERARLYESRLNGRHFDDPVDDSVPCPLLVQDRCSVYDIRPLVCRGYNSTDVNACRLAHADPAARVPIFAVIKDVADGTSVGVAQALKTVGLNDALVDLGTALGLALSAGPAFAPAVVEGADVLGPAENASWADELWNLVCGAARQLGMQV
jgi:Fe-S-cluster containining protein